MARYIGVRHRTKKTAAGETRPTLMVVLEEDGTGRTIEFEDDTAELDWALGRLPTEYRVTQEGEDISMFPARHVKEVKGTKKVPCAYDGLRAGDVVALSLGGSGDRLAFALSRQAVIVGAEVIRIPPFALKAARGDADKTDDAALLAKLARNNYSLFYTTKARERQLILVREYLKQMKDVMKDRIACEQRLRQRLNGKVFCTSDGQYPEGALEDLFDAEKAKDTILMALLKEEKSRERELDKALEALDIYTELFKPVEGLGTRIAARLIAAIMDIRRFRVSADVTELNKDIAAALELGEYQTTKLTVAAEYGGTIEFEQRWSGFERVGQVAKWQREHGQADNAGMLQTALELMRQRGKLQRKAWSQSLAKFHKFCGVAVGDDGKFLRRRAGVVANWHPDARQALWLLANQFNYRPDSYWGQRLLHHKTRLRQLHPEPEVLEGKKRYTDGHILKMAKWRTVSDFLTWLMTEWVRFDGGAPVRHRTPSPTTPTEANTEVTEVMAAAS